MAEKLKSNNIEFDQKKFEQKPAGDNINAPNLQNLNLIDQYKVKLAKAQKDLDQKLKEIQSRDKAILDLK